MWWVWLLCAWGVAAGERGAPGDPGDPLAAPDALLHAVQAAGKARAALCTAGAACAGAVWSRHWLLVRASCIDNRVLAPARLLLHTEPKFCKYVVKTDLNWPGPVLARFLHPRYAAPVRDEPARWGASPAPAPPRPAPFDAALIMLAEPAAVPLTANHSRAYAAIPPSLAMWLRSTMAEYPGSLGGAAPEERQYLASSPMRLLALTVLLPSGALLLLCVLLLRYTAAPARPGAYDLLDDDDELPDEPDAPPPPLRTVV